MEESILFLRKQVSINPCSYTLTKLCAKLFYKRYHYQSNGFNFQNLSEVSIIFYLSSDPKKKEKAKMGSRKKIHLDLKLMFSDQIYKSS